MASTARIQAVNTKPTKRRKSKSPTKRRPSQAPQKADDYVDLVKRVAYNMARRLPARVDVRDLIGAGTIGLLDAMNKYDPTQNDNFEAYAEIRIRGAILDELRGLDWVPRSVRQKSHKIERATRELEGELGRHPTDEEMAGHLKVKLGEYFNLLNDVRSITVLSLDDLLGGAGAPSATAALEVPEDSAVEQLCRRATASAVAAAIEQLPERERLVLSLYYLEGLKLKDIGEILGVTESRVCQIHGHAINRLKGMLRDKV